MLGWILEGKCFRCFCSGCLLPAGGSVSHPVVTEVFRKTDVSCPQLSKQPTKVGNKRLIFVHAAIPLISVPVNNYFNMLNKINRADVFEFTSNSAAAEAERISDGGKKKNLMK